LDNFYTPSLLQKIHKNWLEKKAQPNLTIRKESSETSLEIFDLSDIPPFNQDLENNMPPKVKEFKTKIRESDAILIATSFSMLT
jgi:NAD(P)H-dependent FMN reductase